MRITETQLRRIIDSELSQLKEAGAVERIKPYYDALKHIEAAQTLLAKTKDTDDIVRRISAARSVIVSRIVELGGNIA